MGILDTPVWPQPAKARALLAELEQYLLAVNRDIRRILRVPVLQRIDKELDSSYWQAELKKPRKERRRFLDLVVTNTELTQDQVNLKSLDPIFHIDWDQFRAETMAWVARANRFDPGVPGEAQRKIDQVRDYQARFNALAKRYGSDRSDAHLLPRSSGKWYHWLAIGLLVAAVIGILVWIL